MTTELEKQFFDTFGIEEGLQKLQFITEDRVMRMETVYGYPTITDRHYLELIAILGYFEVINKVNINTLKEHILNQYLDLDSTDFRELKHKVQQLFKEY